MFSGLVKKSFDAVNENSAITLFFVLFLIVVNFFLPYIFSAKSFITTSVLMICLFLFTAVFIAGWISVLKESIEKEKIKEKNYSAIFFDGAGKNFIPVVMSLFIYVFLLAIILFLAGKFAQYFFGSLDFLFKDILNLASEQNAFMNYIKTLSVEQLYVIYGWQLSFMLAIAVFNFFFLFMGPAIAKENKVNMFLKAFVAFKDSVFFTFKKFLPVVGIYFLICFISGFLNILRAITASNIIFAILFLFIYIYFAAYSIMLIFNYYEKNCCNNGSDRIGEDEICDKPCQDN